MFEDTKDVKKDVMFKVLPFLWKEVVSKLDVISRKGYVLMKSG